VNRVETNKMKMPSGLIKTKKHRSTERQIKHKKTEWQIAKPIKKTDKTQKDR
jgi:hypothetical protein